MKNYKKIYKKLIKEIKKFEENEREHGCFTLSMDNIRDYISTSYALTVFEVLKEIINEVDGKEYSGQIMHKKEFEKWKKQIKS